MGCVFGGHLDKTLLVTARRNRYLNLGPALLPQPLLHDIHLIDVARQQYLLRHIGCILVVLLNELLNGEALPWHVTPWPPQGGSRNSFGKSIALNFPLEGA